MRSLSLSLPLVTSEKKNFRGKKRFCYKLFCHLTENFRDIGRKLVAGLSKLQPTSSKKRNDVKRVTN